MFTTTLPDSAKVQIYPSATVIDKETQNVVIENFQDFLHTWNYHGTPLQTDVFFLNNQFLILVINNDTIPGGCSLDVLSRFVTKVENETQIHLNNRNLIYILRGNEIITIPFNRASEFTLFQEDKVVNLLCKNVAELRTEFIVSPAISSYARLFSN
ncbi:MAG: hypothetical protein M0R38_04480 [Bacteroidia bacterium]|nr:hypothetical protein [Bacteroidia bacterium]